MNRYLKPGPTPAPDASAYLEAGPKGNIARTPSVARSAQARPRFRQTSALSENGDKQARLLDDDDLGAGLIGMAACDPHPGRAELIAEVYDRSASPDRIGPVQDPV